MKVGDGTPGPGRPKGSKSDPAKLTPELRRKIRESIVEKASEHALECLQTMLTLMRTAETEQIRLKAANDLLDRAIGKPTQVMAGDEEGAPVRIEQIIRKIIDA